MATVVLRVCRVPLLLDEVDHFEASVEEAVNAVIEA